MGAQAPSLFIGLAYGHAMCPTPRTSRGTATNTDKKSRSTHLNKAEAIRERFKSGRKALLSGEAPRFENLHQRSGLRSMLVFSTTM
jgi:hypothetical protein